MEIQKFFKFNDINPEQISGILKQYYDIKKKYKDYIVLFRAGDFYETYFDDAITFSNVSSITLTKKKFKNMPDVLMAGVNNRSVQCHIDKLLKNNYKVVIVEEKSAKSQDGILMRDIAKIYTNGTLFEPEFLTPNENNYIASISKNNENYDFSYADVSTGDIYKTKGTLNDVILELSRISPKELLIRESSNIDPKIYSNYKYEILDEEFYEEEENYAYSGILNYSKNILKDFVIEFEQVEDYNVKDFMQMDFLTRKNLELNKNSYNNTTYGSLLWTLDNCKTPMGKRLLSSFISSPLYNIEEIEKRYDLLDKILSIPDSEEKLSSILDNTGDISRISSKLSNKTVLPLEFLTLKDGFSKVKEASKLIEKLNSPIFNKTRHFKILSDFYEILNKTIEDDTDKIEKGYYIKKGADTELDLLFMDFSEIEGQIEEYRLSLIECTKIKNLKIIQKQGSFYIEVPNGATSLIGYDFRLCRELRNTKRYTTGKLLELEEKYFSTLSKITNVQKTIFSELKTNAGELTGQIREYSKNIALLDVFYSFLKSVKEYDLKRPFICEGAPVKIQKGRHIVVQKLNEFVPLDFNFENSKLIVLTGANGAGKSTLLKELGLITVLSQAGCFIPSESVKISPVDRLFAVLNVSDNLFGQKSSHQAQMSEISKVMEYATKKSLILFDEIGKSTSYKDGISILYAVIRYFIEEKFSTTVCATHYLEIKDLLKDYENDILYLQMNKNRQITKGIAKNSRGVDTLYEENLPEKVIKFANDIIKSSYTD